jgi:CHAT domain-containing protein
MAAGCPSAVVSQWKVRDEATATLMKTFYTGLKAGKGKAKALREAAMALRQDGLHRHPYFWAPFLLVGDGR